MFFIEEKNKCINNCKNDDKYKYLYNGICYEECPNNLNSRDYLCMDEQSDSFILIEKDLDFNYTKLLIL